MGLRSEQARACRYHVPVAAIWQEEATAGRAWSPSSTQTRAAVHTRPMRPALRQPTGHRRHEHQRLQPDDPLPQPACSVRRSSQLHRRCQPACMRYSGRRDRRSDVQSAADIAARRGDGSFCCPAAIRGPGDSAGAHLCNRRRGRESPCACCWLCSGVKSRGAGRWTWHAPSLLVLRVAEKRAVLEHN